MKRDKRIRFSLFKKYVASGELVADEKLTSFYRNNGIGIAESNVYSNSKGNIFLEIPLGICKFYEDIEEFTARIYELEKSFWKPVLSPEELLSMPYFFDKIDTRIDELKHLIGRNIIPTLAGLKGCNSALIKLQNQYKKIDDLDSLYPLLVSYTGQVIVAETDGVWTTWTSEDGQTNLPKILGKNGILYEPCLWLYREYAERKIGRLGIYNWVVIELNK